MHLYLRQIFWALCLFSLCRCGIVKYPGQPGLLTNSYTKIDLEDLELEGLYVYEVSYDNRTGGPGVGAIVTKLYRNAQTYTSNVRTNADGTLYRAKAPYEGAEVQMISLPAQNQIILPPNPTVQLLFEYFVSLDELDDRNLVEEMMFKPTHWGQTLGSLAYATRKMRWDLVRASRLLPNGNLSYEVNSVELGEKKYNPTKSVLIETSFLQNGIRTNLSPDGRKELVTFLETHFPKGYQGIVKVHVKGANEPVAMKLGVHTLKTLGRSGMIVIKNASRDLIETVIRQYFARG